MAPSDANLFMIDATRMRATALDGLTYKRFIDDLIMVWLHGKASLT